MLDTVESFHKSGYIHNDIKPDNFRIKANNFYIVDFGIAKSYKKEDGTHVSEGEKKGIKGTPVFTSINSHQGNALSRRDDLESLAYTLMYILQKGALPWNEDPSIKLSELKPGE